jgi:hypothetical protein
MFRISRMIAATVLILAIVLSGCTLPEPQTNESASARNTPDKPMLPSNPTKTNNSIPEQITPTWTSIPVKPTQTKGGSVEPNIPTQSPIPPIPTKTGSKVEPDSGNVIPPGTAEKIVNWWGVIKKTQPGAQYDDYFERQDLGSAIYFGIDSMNPAVQAQIKSLRNSGKIVHLYGTLLSNVPDYNGSQIQVERIEIGG